MAAPLNEKSTLHNNFSHKRTAFRPLHVHSQTMKFLDFAFMSKMVRFYQGPVHYYYFPNQMLHRQSRQCGEISCFNEQNSAVAHATKRHLSNNFCATKRHLRSWRYEHSLVWLHKLMTLLLTQIITFQQWFVRRRNSGINNFTTPESEFKSKCI